MESKEVFENKFEDEIITINNEDEEIEEINEEINDEEDDEEDDEEIDEILEDLDDLLNEENDIVEENDTIEENINIVEKKDRTTFPILTKYEKNFLLGFRTQQIINGSVILIDINKLKEKTAYSIAQQELKEKKIPFKIKRVLPNGKIELWDIEELIIN